MRSWQFPAIPEISLDIPPVRLWDTSRQSVVPVSPGHTVKIYVCGITPYDATHLGHAATYLIFDVLNRIFRAQHKQVHYVQNVTDVDDPLFERAQRDQIDWEVLGDKETELFRSDMQALRVIPPEEYIGAIESIPQIGVVVQDLLDRGIAYQLTNDQYPDVYFPLNSTENFGYISHFSRETMEEIFVQRGGDPDRPGKRDKLDALLWRAARPGEPAWDSPMGLGRPGWHIECAVIALEYMKAPIDIQGGGNDLIFPHHEFSAAHAECIVNEPRFARHYLHTGMIGLDGEKMSKSRGNLVFVSRLLDAGTDPNIIRLGLLGGHYAEDRMWNQQIVHRAQHRLDLWKKAINSPVTVAPEATLTEVARLLSDNLRIPEAFLVIDHWAEQSMAGLGHDSMGGKIMSGVLDAVLGLKI